MKQKPDEIPVTEIPADIIRSKAVPVMASQLVADDTDRPKADNSRPLPETEKPEEKPPEKENGVDAARREKQKAYMKEWKAKKRAEKAPRVEKAPPSFGDLGGNAIGPNPTTPGNSAGILNPVVTKRDYGVEAVSLFVPVSMFLGKTLGDHWGVEVDNEKKTLAFTPEQNAYIASLARWLEHEKFPPMSPRYEFLIQTAAYSLPKLKTDPTPERLKIGWLKVSGWFKRIFKRGDK